MRHPIIWLATLALGLGALGACDGRSGPAACDEVACEAWQECTAGACVALPGRCDTYLDCAADEICGDDHQCLGPTRPPAGFFDPLAGNSVTFEYRGLINHYDDLTAGSLTDGLGAWSVHVSGETQAFTESAYTYRRAASDTHPDAVLRGHELITLGVSRVREASASHTRYHHLATAVAVDSLEAMQANETPEAPAPAALTLKLWEVDVQLRDWDRAQFRRYCLVAERAPAADEALFLRYHHNETYAAGEDLQLWGNLGLGALVEITAANENDRCAYDINGVPATRQAYADGLAQTTPELPCDTPPDLLEPVATESATFIFLGLINDVAVGFASFTFGLGGVSLTADGTGLVADDYYLLAYRYATSPTNDLLVVQTLGSVAQPGPDRYQYLLFRLVVARLALLEMTAGGQDSVGYDPARMSAAVEWVDDKARGADSWYKVCPRLVTVPVGGSGAIAACYDATTQFLAGEQLELGGSLPMTSDATTIAALYGTPEPCHCYLNLTTNPVTCAEFDAQ